MAGDELSSGREPWSRRRWLVLGAVVALLLALVAADRTLHAREVRRLQTAVAAAERVVDASRRSVNGVLEYQATITARDDLPDELRRGLQANVARAAARWQPRLAEARSGVAAVDVLPWHGDVDAARTAHLARLDAWSRLLARTGGPEDGEAPDVAGTQERAEQQLRLLTGDRVELSLPR